MMERYKLNWNLTCDKIADYFHRQNEYFLEKNEKSKKFFNNIKLILYKNIPNIYNFVSLCSEYKSPIIKIKNKEFSMDYKKRGYIVYTISFMNSIFRNKSFFPTYFFLSSIIARENLNLRNYKFNLKTLPEKIDNNQINNNINNKEKIQNNKI